jgi:thiol-disulfide isomerase/thioredoxin
MEYSTAQRVGQMKTIMVSKLLFILLCVTTLTVRADEQLPLLTVNGETYSNVTVTAVTATDIFFTHAKGMGNAKLKDLDPSLQAHFHYNPAKSAMEEQQMVKNDALYHQYLLTVKPPTPVPQEAIVPPPSDDDFVAPKLYARSVRGQAPPPFAVEQWLTPKPDITGKFVLIDFWATWCNPCRESIPQLNAFFEKYQNHLVIIGITDESEADVRKMTDPQIEYAVAIDTQARMMKALEITGIPHSILIDPHGIVRYEGMPGYLDEQKLEHFLLKYQ